MQLPRISEELALSNLALVAIGTVVILVGFGTLVGLTIWATRRAAKASNLDAVEQFIERIWRPVRVIAMVLSLLVLLGATVLATVSIWQERDLHAEIQALLGDLDWDLVFWTSVRVIAVIIGVIVGSLYLHRIMQPLLPKLAKRLLDFEALAGQDELVNKLVGQSKPVINVLLVYGAFNLGAEALGLPDGLQWLVAIIIWVLLVWNIAKTLVLIVHLATESLDKLGETKLLLTRLAVYYQNVRKLWPLAKRCLEALVFLVAAKLVLGEFETFSSIAQYADRIMGLILIFLGARILVEVSGVLMQELLGGGAGGTQEGFKRRVTLSFLLQSFLKYLIYFAAAIAMLYQIGINPAPFLAGAGILGLAISLGAQKLVNDIVNGFFILFEGQILAGDFVQIGNAVGTVEQVMLRVSTVRDGQGRLHTIRNGNIENVINYSRAWVNACVEVGVAYEMDLDKVIKVLLLAGDKLKEENPDKVLEKTVVRGIQSFGDSSVNFSTATKVTPGSNGFIERAYRKLIFEFFREHEIEIPYPKQVEIHAGPPAPQ